MNFSYATAAKFGKAGEHIVCSDLLLGGYDAFMVSDPGAPFDILINFNDELYKVQVKTCIAPTHHYGGYKDGIGNKNKIKTYTFAVSARGYRNTKKYKSGQVDIFALVALDTKIVTYIPYSARNGSICFRVPSLKGQYYNEKWMFVRPVILEMLSQGKRPIEIQKILNISSPTYYNAIRKLNDKSVSTGVYLDNYPIEKCLDFIKNNIHLDKNTNFLNRYLYPNSFI